MSLGRAGGRRWPRVAVLGVLLVASGCNSNQSITNPATTPASDIATLWWAMFAGAMVIFAFVLGLLVLAYVRRRRPGSGGDDRGPYRVILGGGLVAPIVVLSILFIFVIRVMPAVSAPPLGSTKLTVDVIGHQWFWEVRYPGTNAVTANEIHIPAGTPVNLVARTADVIHSFWVPRLNRKIDMIPGRTNRIELDAPQTGVYPGQCSEFCGLEHADMGLEVIVQKPAAFRSWLANQARPARAPTTPQQMQGRQVFLTASCADCHTIRGTPATGRAAPDLTHVGSRQTIAALTLPNTPSSLFDWITNPQLYKPGARMPGFASLSPSARHALVAYLESLK